MAYNFFKDLFDVDEISNIGKSFEGFGNFIWNTATNIGNGIKDLWNDFTGKTIAEKNLEFQRENLDYTKGLNEKLMEREDTAYQRTGADMRAAGISPLTMNGTNGAGTLMGANAPQANKTSDIQAIGQILNVLNSVSNTRSNASVSNAQANLINAQADNQKIKNLWENDILASTFEGLDLKNISNRFNNEILNIDWNNKKRSLAFNEQFGLSDNMPDFVKMLNYATHQGNLDKDWNKNYTPDSWENFGKYFTFQKDFKNPSFSNLQGMLEQSNLKGALQDNAITNALLKLIGIY